MSDEIIKELWTIKENIAREHGYDIDALVAHLNTKDKLRGQRVVKLRSSTEATPPSVPDRLKNADVDPPT
jgi:hypothetical protein